MNIATSLNKKYRNYTIVMLTSLMVNQDEHVDAYILNCELDADDKEYMAFCMEEYDISLIFFDVDKTVFDKRLPFNEQWSIETYFRLFLIDLLPESVERILYLDVDIAVNGNLSEFYHVDFDGCEVIACADMNGCNEWKDFSPKQQEMFLKMYENGFVYFNAGVMLFNIKKMRGKYSFDYYVKIMEEWNYEMKAPDQDILNYAHWDKAGYVNWEEYDLFAKKAHNDNLTLDTVKRNTKIIHYAGQKPWDVDLVHFDLEKIWWEYAMKSKCAFDMAYSFIFNLMGDTELDKNLRNTLGEFKDLRQKFNEVVDINQKLVAIIEKMQGQ